MRAARPPRAVSSQAVSALLPGLHGLRSLDLSGCQQLRTLALPRLRELRALTTAWCAGLAELVVEHCAALRALRAHGCASLRALVLRGCVELRTLELSRCSALCDGTLGAVVREQPALLVLTVSACAGLRAPELRSASLEELKCQSARALRSMALACPRLRVLGLGGCVALETLRLLDARVRTDEAHAAGAGQACEPCHAPQQNGCAPCGAPPPAATDDGERASAGCAAAPALARLSNVQLAGCKRLCDDAIRALLHESPALVACELRGCSALAPATLADASAHCASAASAGGSRRRDADAASLARAADTTFLC